MTKTNFPPVEGKTWEIECRKLSSPDDQLGLLGALASHMGPDNLHDFPAFDFRRCPEPSDNVKKVIAILREDDRSTSCEIGAAANWALEAFQDAVTADDMAWADRALSYVWGETHKHDQSRLVKEARRLLDAMRQFETATGESCGYATALMAAVAVRYYGHDYVLGTRWDGDVHNIAAQERNAAKAKEAA